MQTNDILDLFDTGSCVLLKWRSCKQNPVEFVSNNISQLTDYSSHDFMTSKILYTDLIHEDDRKHFEYEMQVNSQSKVNTFIHKPYRIQSHRDTYIWVHDATTIIRDEKNNVHNYVTYLTDISVTKEAIQKESHVATHDHLTLLPNMILFKDRVEQNILDSKRRQSKFAVLYIDIDNFRAINDSLGHIVGDKLLLQLAIDLRKVVRAKDSVCRHGGDEFLLLMDGIKTRDDILVIIDKLFSLNKKPFKIDNHEIYVSYSIGVVMYPEHGESFNQLLQHVDNAMFEAKDKSRNSYKFFSPELYETMKKKQHLYAKLHHALQNNEISLVFQPKIDTKTQKIISAEALVRWMNKDDGFIPPDVFIPIAEDSGQIVHLGHYIFQKSCEALAKILPMQENFIMAINISAIEFQKDSFIPQCQKILEELNLNASSIELELTESVIMDSPEVSIQKLIELKELGFHLAIDDFGTGYSSLSYLKDYPVDTIKIDMSFTRAMLHDAHTLSLVKIIISFNEIFNVKIVAEGVEVEEEYAILKDEGCDIIQGYYFSKPLVFDTLIEYIQKDS